MTGTCGSRRIKRNRRPPGGGALTRGRGADPRGGGPVWGRSPQEVSALPAQPGREPKTAVTIQPPDHKQTNTGLPPSMGVPPGPGQSVHRRAQKLFPSGNSDPASPLPGTPPRRSGSPPLKALCARSLQTSFPPAGSVPPLGQPSGSGGPSAYV